MTPIPAVALCACVAVLVPLTIRKLAIGRVGLMIACGLIATESIAIERPGTIAVVLAVPWMCACVSIALSGLARVLARGLRPLPELAISVGMINLAVGAFWLLLFRAGDERLGFPPLIVALTAVHFHVAGFLLPVMVGFAARARPGRIADAAALLIVIAVPMTAIGIAASRPLELGASLCMATGGLLAAIAILRAARGRPFLYVSGAALLLAMPLAANFGLGAHGVYFSIAGMTPIDSMAATHGVVLIVGLAGAGVLAWTLVPPPAAPALPTFSRLVARGRVTADLFARAGVEEPGRVARGLVDRLDELAEGNPALDAAQVDPAIRAFYEDTTGFAMTVTPAWRAGFRAGGRLWARIARRLGQLQLPTAPQADDIQSRIVALDGARDGRVAPRAWIRTFADGRAMYAAAYATDRGRMNIAFPLPLGNLASVLRMESIAGGGVVVHTRGPDLGIWLIVRAGRWALPIKLPLREAITVNALPDGVLDARHDLWIAGVRYLTLRYTMTRKC